MKSACEYPKTHGTEDFSSETKNIRALTGAQCLLPLALKALWAIPQLIGPQRGSALKREDQSGMIHTIA
jgi:hypothetical protein